MEQLFLTIGNIDLLSKIISENKNRKLIPLSGENGKNAIFSFEKLTGVENPLIFDSIKILKQADQAPMYIQMTYLTGDEKHLITLEKFLNASKMEIENSNVLDFIIAKEASDLKRYVLFTSWNNFQDLQSFKESETLKTISKSFFSSFSVVYTRGFA